ncbi:manganese efflux pump MntP family protein [Garciella nitratireducens]|uniref:Putative manganese efflux pump MntP n=1 Tax=Garciella nitratireducens DSM 15102 TaxID=1121911 RepID=A0A1T4KQ94_9FIRM|nr:manganese efflux pump MntP family protein [Garciella nitratireducens]SJZ44570.1 Putative Mn2+ efflux pump MntP [Garciella nitratireducens DSM 15102]
MNLFELFFTAIGVSMDAFAVAISKGLSLKKVTFKNAMIVGLYFGFFQLGMPLIGYFLGVQFQRKITAIDHWIAFVLLGIIGINMIKESKEKSRNKVDEVAMDITYESKESGLSFKTMLFLSIATSIDALAVGVTFAFLQVNIVLAVFFIGVVTFLFSFIGVKIGNIFGIKLKSKAEWLGGFILVGMGSKILLEHLGMISF